MKKTWFLTVFVVLSFFVLSLLSTDANAQYRQVVNPDSLPSVDFTPGSGDDTRRLERLIDMQSSRTNGGRIRIRRGSYQLTGVLLKSNVYIRFDSGVTITTGENRSAAFQLQGGIENVSLVGPANFNVLQIARQVRHRAFVCHGVTNFEISNFRINDNRSRFCSIIMSPMNEEVNGATPLDGTVENITIDRASGGFGGIQIHAAQSVDFSNIRCDGGVTLRFESGIENNTGIDNIDARVIRSTNGRAAALFQPHALDHGTVSLRNVRSTGSAFAVIIRNGFVDQNSRENGFTSAGSFERVTLRGVQATFGARNAMLRPASFPVIPAALSSTVRNLRSGDTIFGPSISAVFNTASYPVSFRGDDPLLRGFREQSNAVIDGERVLRRSETRRLQELFRNAPQQDRRD